MFMVLPILATLIGIGWAICAWLIFKTEPVRRKTSSKVRPRRRPVRRQIR